MPMKRLSAMLVLSTCFSSSALAQAREVPAASRLSLPSPFATKSQALALAAVGSRIPQSGGGEHPTRVQGWWKVPPGECTTIGTFPDPGFHSLAIGAWRHGDFQGTAVSTAMRQRQRRLHRDGCILEARRKVPAGTGVGDVSNVRGWPGDNLHLDPKSLAAKGWGPAIRPPAPRRVGARPASPLRPGDASIRAPRPRSGRPSPRRSPAACRTARRLAERDQLRRHGLGRTVDHAALDDRVDGHLVVAHVGPRLEMPSRPARLSTSSR